MSEMAEPVLLIGDDAAERTGVLIIPRAGALPDIGWVGVADGAAPVADLAAVSAAGSRSRTSWEAWLVGSRVSVLPEQASGWLGKPGLLGYRPGSDHGTAWSTAFVTRTVEATTAGVRIDAVDGAAELGLCTEMEALPGGSVRIRHVLTNLGLADYVVDALDVVVPVPESATEVLDFTGRWAMERRPQRHPIADGQWVREHRRGTRDLDTAMMLVAGPAGFGYATGDLMSLHVAWSGNHRHRVERVSPGVTVLAGGELLLPGEVVLAPGDSYRTPWVHVTASRQGLDGLAAAQHRYVRSLAAHPDTAPVMLNVWEAVYFDHHPEHIAKIADVAAELGVERFVLDDGWFLDRDDETTGLGDWVVDPAKWPDGLGPLAEHVRELGMQFGLWWEPEGVNPDSRLYRRHPDWILAVPGRLPVLERHQYVLDLARSDVREHLLEAFDVLVRSCPVDFVKWDHNRDIVDGGSSAGGRPGVHEQTLGYYALLDELRRRHPEISWESCASGGGRIDLEALARVQSVWTSDCTDPISRQHIQHWTAQLVPLEYLGAQIAHGTSHQTGRTSSLDMRAATALFGQFGIAIDPTDLPADDRERVASWIAIYKRHRALLHSGRLTRVDVGPETILHGVVADDGAEAIFTYAQLGETVGAPPRLHLPGLDPSATYRVAHLVPGGGTGPGWPVDGLTATGATLRAVGLPGPARAPETVVVAHLRRVPQHDQFNKEASL